MAIKIRETLGLVTMRPCDEPEKPPPRKMNEKLINLFAARCFPNRSVGLALKEIEQKSQNGTVDMELCRNALSLCAIASLQQHHQVAADLACEAQELIKDLMEKQSPEIICTMESAEPIPGHEDSVYVCNTCSLQHRVPVRPPLMDRLEVTLMYAQSFGIAGIELLYLGQDAAGAEYLTVAHSITQEAHACIVHRYEVSTRIRELFTMMEKMLRLHQGSSELYRPMTVPTNVGNRPPTRSEFDAQRSSSAAELYRPSLLPTQEDDSTRPGTRQQSSRISRGELPPTIRPGSQQQQQLPPWPEAQQLFTRPASQQQQQQQLSPWPEAQQLFKGPASQQQLSPWHHEPSPQLSTTSPGTKQGGRPSTQQSQSLSTRPSTHHISTRPMTRQLDATTRPGTSQVSTRPITRQLDVTTTGPGTSQASTRPITRQLSTPTMKFGTQPASRNSSNRSMICPPRGKGEWESAAAAWWDMDMCHETEEKENISASMRRRMEVEKVRPPKAELPPGIFRIKLKYDTYGSPSPEALDLATKVLRGHSSRRLHGRLGSEGHKYTHQDIVDSTYFRIKTQQDIDNEDNFMIIARALLPPAYPPQVPFHRIEKIKKRLTDVRELVKKMTGAEKETERRTIVHMPDTVETKEDPATKRISGLSLGLSTHLGKQRHIFGERDHSGGEDVFVKDEDVKEQEQIATEEDEYSKDGNTAISDVDEQPGNMEGKRRSIVEKEEELDEFELWAQKLYEDNYEERKNFSYDFPFRHCRDPCLASMKSKGLPLRRTKARHLHHLEMARVYRKLRR